MDAKVNVIAYRKVPSTSPNQTLYDGLLTFKNGTYSLQEFGHEKGRTVQPGFFTNLKDVAESVEGILFEETRNLSPLQRIDIVVHYDSNVNDTLIGGPRGYTNFSGSYLQRPLNESEMERLVVQVDKRMAKMFNPEAKRRKK